MPQFQRLAESTTNVYSYTKLADYLRCPWYYYQKYILGNDTKPNKNMLYGQRIHSKCEQLCLCMDHEDTKEIIKGLSLFDQEHAVKLAEFYSNKYLAEPPEFETVINIGNDKAGNPVFVEVHIDSIYFDEYGTLHINDWKTSKLIPDRAEIQYNLQLNFYTWVYIEWLRKNKETIQYEIDHPSETDSVMKPFILKAKMAVIEGMAKIKIGQWMWQYDYPMEVEYQGESYADQVIALHEDLIQWGSNPDEYPRAANQYCAGCHLMPACIPDLVPDTYNGLKSYAELIKQQAELKKAIITREFEDLDTKVIQAEGEPGYYVLKSRVMTKYEIESALDFLKLTVPDALKKFINITKEDGKLLGLDKNKIKLVTTSVSVWPDYVLDIPKEKVLKKANVKKSKTQKEVVDQVINKTESN